MRIQLATAKVYFFRGWSYAQLPAIGISAAYALEAKYGIPFLFSAVIGIVSCVIIGAVDYSHGIARNENNLAWELTPVAKKLCKDVEEIKNVLAQSHPKQT